MVATIDRAGLTRILTCLLLVAAGPAAGAGDYVGSARCGECHAEETARWRGSHHDRAMEVAGDSTVLGNFGGVEIAHEGVTTRFYRTADGGYAVRTEGPDGEAADYSISHTFGWYPLQQYLVPFPGGRLQALGIAWDARPAGEGGQRWFHLYPGQQVAAGHPLHWTSPDQTWNHQCAECHSTGLVKGYDFASDSYDTTYSEIDVACEACHGPGAEHVAWAEGPRNQDPGDQANGLASDLATGARWVRDAGTRVARRAEGGDTGPQLQTCARCHSRRGQIHGDYEHGRPLADTHRLALLDDGLYFIDGQVRDEVYVHGSFLQSRMHQAGVVCSDCHDPHSLELRAPGNALCTRCHAPERYDARAHHHHAADSAGARCAACHMPERTYMMIDARADHSMRVPRPDLAARLGVPDACTGCHTDREPGWAATAVAGWTGGESPPEHFAVAFDAAARGRPGANEALAELAEDGSRPAIVRASAIARLRPPVGEPIAAKRARWLVDADPLVREAAVRSMAESEMRERLGLALPLLDDPVRSVRFAALRVLVPALRLRLPAPAASAIGAGLEDYLNASRINLDRAETHVDLGVIAAEIGRPRQAEAAYRTAIRLDPTFVPAYANLADLYRTLGREQEARRVLRQGLDADSVAAPLWHALGLALVRAGRVDEALTPLETAARLDAENVRFALVLGLALRETGRAGEAVAVLERALQRLPHDRDLLAATAQAHAAAGDAASAARYLEMLE